MLLEIFWRRNYNCRCPPESDLGIVAELQASGGPASEHDRHSLITRAWTKIPLFDNNSRLIAGRFRIPMRNVPIKPFLHVSQVQRVPKVKFFKNIGMLLKYMSSEILRIKTTFWFCLVCKYLRTGTHHWGPPSIIVTNQSGHKHWMDWHMIL